MGVSIDRSLAIKNINNKCDELKYKLKIILNKIKQNE